MPERNTEVIPASVGADLDQKLQEVSRATGLDRGTLIRLAVLTELPEIESAKVPPPAGRRNGTHLELKRGGRDDSGSKARARFR